MIAKFRFDGKGARLKTERTENTAVSDCCFGMQDHLYDFELLLKPVSEEEKLAVAQTVSPSDTNAKAQSRKMVSIPSKAAGHSGVFCPAFFLSAPEPRKAPCQLSAKSCNIPVDLYEFNKPVFRFGYGALRGSGAYGMKQYRKGGTLFWRLPLQEVLESLVFRRSSVGEGKVTV